MKKKLIFMALAAILAFAMIGCDTGGGDPKPVVTSVSIAGPEILEKGQVEKYTKTVVGKNGAKDTVDWTTDSVKSTVDQFGNLSIGDNEDAGTVTITATSTVTKTQKDSITVTIVTKPAAGVADTEEYLALENGSQAIFAFPIPAGSKFENYVGLKATYQLDDPNIVPDTLSATAPDPVGDKQQIRFWRLYGNFLRENFISDDGDVTMDAYIAKFDAYNASAIAHGGAGQTWDWTDTGIDVDNPGSWFTPIFTFAENVPNGGYNASRWPADTFNGTVFFGIGITAPNGQKHIVQKVKNVTLIAKADATMPDGTPVADIISPGSGMDKPAFAGYSPIPREASPYRGTTKPVFVTLDKNGHGGNDALRRIPVATGTSYANAGLYDLSKSGGWIFKKWTTDASGDTDVVSTAVINADVTLYAQWEEDPDYVAVPAAPHPFPAATGPTTFTLGLPTWNNSTSQQGWDTYKATNNPALIVGYFTWAESIVINATELNTLEFTWHNKLGSNGWVGGTKQFADNSDSTVWLAGKQDANGDDYITVVEESDGTFTATVKLSEVLARYDDFIATDPEGDSEWVGLLFQSWGLADKDTPNYTSNIKSVKLIIPAPAP